MLQTFWNTLIVPIIRRPSRFQAAALCWRPAESAGLTGIEVLLITSRDTGRWVLPKGWPKRGYDAGGTAAEEAWEEAGVKPASHVFTRIGRYSYDKRLSGGVPVPTDVEVFAIRVAKLHDEFPERAERRREWMTPEQAAAAVVEPELKKLLRNLPADLVAGTRGVPG